MTRIDYTQYMGIPWNENRLDYCGCNCWGLCCIFLRDELGINTNRLVSLYDGCFNIQSVVQIADDEKKRWQKVIDPQKGDIVELSLSSRDFHVGVVPYAKHVLHVEEGGVSEILPLSSKRIKGRVRSFWRYTEN